MKKLVIITFILTGVLAAIYFSACNNKKSEEPQASNKEDSVKKVIARGEYLANHVAPCMDCHSKRDFTKFSGPVIPGTEGMGGEVFDNKLMADIPGVVYARNITPDP